MNNHHCNCVSYNAQTGSEPNVTLRVPPHILPYTDGRESVCVDACIADCIRALWGNGLPTINSCCGHNLEEPQVVIHEHFNPHDYLSLLGKIDSRRWVVSRWDRVEYHLDDTERLVATLPSLMHKEVYGK